MLNILYYATSWIVLPGLLFYMFYLRGKADHVCYSSSEAVGRVSVDIVAPVVKRLPCRPVSMSDVSLNLERGKQKRNVVGNCANSSIEEALSVMQVLKTEELFEYKTETLAKVASQTHSVVVHPPATGGRTGNECKLITHTHAALKQKGCVAIVRVKSSNNTLNLLRFDFRDTTVAALGKIKNHNRKVLKRHNSKIKTVVETEKPPVSTGLFRQASSIQGRTKQAIKFGPLLNDVDELETLILSLLQKRQITPWSDVVVMVVNDGEMDIFSNFVCSCYAHNISLHNVMVFAGSGEIVPLIEATGAMGVYHADTFAAVSKDASHQYLDKVFVDMMWYKAFSVWMLVKLHYNVLFQDVDLVWFKEPFEYFHSFPSWQKQQQHHRGGAQREQDADTPGWLQDKVKSNRNPMVDAFFSDDGNRGMRYAPFYGNSGFYYVLANDKMEYWAWSVLTSFEMIASTGSHQNAVTTCLIESMDLANVTTQVLDINLFPTGMKYHHDKKYMKKLDLGLITPYGFHMCWTANKIEKLRYFKLSNMWHVSNQCDIEDLRPPSGRIYSGIRKLQTSATGPEGSLHVNAVFKKLCCKNPRVSQATTS